MLCTDVRYQTSAIRARRGITLLEVLVSLGVLSIGLLGVAALIPIGTFAVSETTKADRSAALGRAAKHEVRVRKMLERMQDDGTTARWRLERENENLDDIVTSLETRRQYLIGQPFAIDPLFIAEATAASPGANGTFDWFPFRPGNSNLIDDDFNYARLLRLQLNIFEDPSLSDSAKLAVFERIFRWQDDLIFDIDEDDPDLRPRQSYLWDDTDKSAAPFPPRPDDDTPPSFIAATTRLHTESNGNYSWMLTAVPDPSELPITTDIAVLTAHKQKTYEVSIVTFYKRDFFYNPTADVPSERFVDITFQGTGIGGGDATISTSAVSSAELAEDYLKVKENQWIMVTGFVEEPRFKPIQDDDPMLPYPIHRRIAKWYRVIRVDDEVEELVPGTFTRQITLAGPDWDAIIATGTTTHATLIDGVIGVYTTTVTLD